MRTRARPEGASAGGRAGALRSGSGAWTDAIPSSACRIRRRSCSMKAGSGSAPRARLCETLVAAASSAAVRAISAWSLPTSSGDGRPPLIRASTYCSKRSASSISSGGPRRTSAIGPRPDQRGLPQSPVLQHLGVAPRDAHPVGRLGHRQALDEAQLEDAPIVCRQATEERSDLSLGSLLASCCRTLRAARGWRGFRAVRRLPAGGHLISADHRQAVEGAPVIGDRILADAVQPADDLGVLARRVELLHRSHEDLRCQVLRVGSIAHPRVDEPIDGHHVRVIDLLEATWARRLGSIGTARSFGFGRHSPGLYAAGYASGRSGTRAERRQQGCDLLEEDAVRLVEGRRIGGVDVDLTNDLALREDGHYDLAARAGEAGEIAWISVDVVHDLRLAGGSRCPAD